MDIRADEPTDAELQGVAALTQIDNHPRMKAVRDWRLWGAIFATASVLALALALWIINGELNHVRDDAAVARAETACRAEVAAKLRDADSEVIRQNALLKEVESGISAALGAIVVNLSRREPSEPLNIDVLDRASINLSVARVGLEKAIAGQQVAREANRNVVETCKET
jgi:hypothetical protein